MEPVIYAVICDSSSKEEEEMELCQPTKLPLAFMTAKPSRNLYNKLVRAA